MNRILSGVRRPKNTYSGVQPAWSTPDRIGWTKPLHRGAGRRCLTGVDSISKGLPEFVSIDEEPDHEIVHALRLGEAQRAADEPFNPRPQIDVFALDFLRVLLAHLMLLSIQMPLVGPPAVGVKLRDTKRCQQLLELQEDIVLPSSEHIRQDLPCAVINGVPQPARVRF